MAHYLDVERHSNHAHLSAFAILIGANDIFFKRDVHAWQVAEKVELVIHRLREQGAYAFLIGVPYSLAKTPHGRAKPDPVFDRFTLELRREIAKLRVRFSSRQYKLRVATFDVDAITSRVLDDPERYGFDGRKTGEACLVGPYGGERHLCDFVEPHVFFDEVRELIESVF